MPSLNVSRIVVAMSVALAALPAPPAHAQMSGGGGMSGGGMGGGKGGGHRGGDSPRAQPPGAPRRAAPSGGEFNGATFTCLEYANGAGETSSNKLQTAFARFWLQGNLAGYYKAQGTLALSDDAAVRDLLMERMSSACLRSPAASIMVVALQGLGPDNLKLPNILIGDLALNTYSCKQHLAAKSGSAGDAVKTDIAEMWAFAFIQGYKLARNAELTVQIQSKPVLVNAILKTCAGNPDMTLLEMAAAVAKKVKLEDHHK
jgi:hypothetical protein